MSSGHNASAGSHPAMDMQQHRNTYAGFMALTKWATIGIVILLILMAIFLV